MPDIVPPWHASIRTSPSTAELVPWHEVWAIILSPTLAPSCFSSPMLTHALLSYAAHNLPVMQVWYSVPRVPQGPHTPPVCSTQLMNFPAGPPPWTGPAPPPTCREAHHLGDCDAAPPGQLFFGFFAGVRVAQMGVKILIQHFCGLLAEVASLTPAKTDSLSQCTPRPLGTLVSLSVIS